jgi:uncharacterized protein YndB with AHSA1/START domain
VIALLLGDSVTFKNTPVVKTQMLIRKPAEDVFEAFVNPAITTKFWFTRSTGKLEVGKQVRWEWEMYGVSAEVRVKAIERPSRILIEWNDPPLPVEWLFAPARMVRPLSPSPTGVFAEATMRCSSKSSIQWEDSRFFWRDSRRCWSIMSPSTS